MTAAPHLYPLTPAQHQSLVEGNARELREIYDELHALHSGFGEALAALGARTDVAIWHAAQLEPSHVG